MHPPRYLVITVLAAVAVCLWAMLYAMQARLSVDEAIASYKNELRECEGNIEKMTEDLKNAKSAGQEKNRRNDDDEEQEDETDALKAEIKRLKKKLKQQRASSYSSSSSSSEDQDATEEQVREVLTTKLQHVSAPECLSFQHIDMTPFAVVIPEKLPGWARRFSKGDSLHEETDDKRQSSFDKIAKTGAWSRDNPSGTGSELGDATDRVLNVLHYIIPHLLKNERRKKIRFLDIPCGDMTWMPEFVEANTNSVEYKGMDIVAGLIKSHKKKFKNNDNMEFEARDVVKEGLPEGEDFDVVFSRHMLQHLTTRDALKVLRHVYKHAQDRGRPVYLLTTTYPDWQAHVDLDPSSSTRVRKLNLQQPPISLPQPLCWSHDFSFSYIGLWKFPLKETPSWVDED